MIVWLNGAPMADDVARIAPSDRAFTLGDGLFETMRLADGAVVHIARHLRRLRAGAAALGIPLDAADAGLAHALAATASANGLTSAALRLTLSRGPAERGIALPASPQPTLVITAGALPAQDGPLHAVIATTTRRNEHSPLSRVKSLNYLDSILARREAVARGADEAVLLNTRGAAAETSIANLIVLRDGRLLTPPVSDGALPGIMREVLVERAGLAEATLLPADLLAADAVFACSALGVRAVASVDGRTLPECHGLLARLRSFGR